jgi:hypothetical protein
MSYLKAAELPRGISPNYVRMSDVTSELAGLHRFQERRDFLFGSFGYQLHASVMQVAGVSGQVVSASDLARGVPKPDSLHPARVKDRRALPHKLSP